MLDYLGLEADLGETERMVRDVAREFVDDRVRPEIGDWFEAGEFPEHLIGELGDLDCYAPNLSWGDLPGVSERAYGLLMQELEAGDSGLRSMASVQGALVMWPIAEYGSEAQRERWLPELASGDAVGCFGLTEPEHGSNPAGMDARARRDGDEWVLDGTKTWITNAPIADVALVWARDVTDLDDGSSAGSDDEPPGGSDDEPSDGSDGEPSDGSDGEPPDGSDDESPDGSDGESPDGSDDESPDGSDGDSDEDAPVRGFLVETDRDGVATSELEGKLSMRASSTGELSLSNVRVPEDAALPGVSGMKGPLSCLTQARYGIAWGAVGIARDCFETARAYALEREQFGGPIARFQLQQAKLADLATGVTTAQLVAHRLAELKERGDLRPQQVSMAKRHNVRVARDAARTAREVLGANGITTDYSPMRHAANVETVYTYEGTDDVHTLVLGEDLTGISAFE